MARASSSPLRIVLVSPHLPPTHVGGVEVYTQYLLRAFAAAGHTVDGVAVERIAPGSAPRCDVETETSGEARTHRLTLTLPPSQSFPLLTTHAPAEAWLESHCRAFRPDVVHVQSGYLLGGPALTVARRLGIPAVVTLHDYWFACPRVTLRHPDGGLCSGAERPSKCAWCLTADKRRYRAINRLAGGRLDAGQDRSTLWALTVGGPTVDVERRQRLLRELLRSAALVMAPTRFVASQVAAGTGYPLDGIRLSRYGMPPMPVARLRRGATLRLAFIGQLAPHKGVHLAIDAVRALADRDLSLTIHGPLEPYPDYVAALRARAGDDPRIVFQGPYQRAALPAIFAATDVVVVPSLWHEVAAIVIQEAQMAGIPVVASTLGGSPELITHDVDGLLFDAARPDDLTRQLARLVDETGLQARLQAAAPAPRTIDDEAQALLAAYQDVVGAA